MRVFLGILSDTAWLLALTLGSVLLCGLAVWLCSLLFSRLMGHRSGRIFDVTSVIGTPIHELGHAIMCLLFCHRIKRICLWSPRAEDGVYGYVEHTYHPKNLWAVLGNLPIAVGPILSGLGVTVLTVRLCFPTQWASYLSLSQTLLQGDRIPSRMASGVLSLLFSLPQALEENWWRTLLGIVIVLSVSLHVSLSWQDIKSALRAFPIYALGMLVLAAVCRLSGFGSQVFSALTLFNLRLLSLFSLVLAFAAAWVLIALFVRVVRMIFSWF